MNCMSDHAARCRDQADAAYEGARRIQESVMTFLICLLLVAGLGAAWSVGDELQQCRLRDAPAEAFGVGR